MIWKNWKSIKCCVFFPVWNNTGIGLHPDLLRHNNNSFDVFHLCCAVTRRLMDYLQKFMMKQSQELKEQFSDLLLTFLTSCTLMVWNFNCSFSSHIGTELLNFIQNVDRLKHFLLKILLKHNWWKICAKVLLLWKKKYTISCDDNCSKWP